MSQEPKKPMTKYAIMLLASNDIPAWWSQISYGFGWILLQGYVIFPSTFNAYGLANLPQPPAGTSIWRRLEREVLFLIPHVPLYAFAWSAVIIGGLGMSWCLFTWRRNYVWGLRAVITPALYSASTGLVSTVANILVTQKGNLSASSRLTLFVTGGATCILTIFWIIYKHILLRKAKKKHFDEAGYHGLGKHGEGQIQAKEMVEGKGNMGMDVISGSSTYL